jgi:uncharacterized protein YjbJ (UPF0337 family)
MNEKEKEESGKHGLADKISGLGQKIIGEIETIGGVLTGDPITRAEGEFNVEVGDVREDLEEDQDELDRRDAAKRRDENNG